MHRALFKFNYIQIRFLPNLQIKVFYNKEFDKLFDKGKN